MATSNTAAFPKGGPLLYALLHNGLPSLHSIALTNSDMRISFTNTTVQYNTSLQYTV